MRVRVRVPAKEGVPGGAHLRFPGLGVMDASEA